MKGSFAEGTRSQDYLVNIIGNEPGHGRNELGGILVVGMQHDDDIRPQFQRLVIATLLVAAIAAVMVMFDDMGDSELMADVDRPVAAVVIYQYYLVYDIERDFSIGFTEGKLRIIGGEDNDQFFAFNHT